MGVGAVVVDTVEVDVVEVRPTPSDNSRTSFPVSAQPTTRSRSACATDMLRTGAPAKGRRTCGGRRTKGNRAAPCASQSCMEAHMPRNDCTTGSSGSGGVGCAVQCSGAGSASLSLPCCRLGLFTPLLTLPLIFCNELQVTAALLVAVAAPALALAAAAAAAPAPDPPPATAAGMARTRRLDSSLLLFRFKYCVPF